MTIDFWQLAHDAVEGCPHTGGVYGRGACAECVEKALRRLVGLLVHVEPAGESGRTAEDGHRAFLERRRARRGQA